MNSCQRRRRSANSTRPRCNRRIRHFDLRMDGGSGHCGILRKSWNWEQQWLRGIRVGFAAEKLPSHFSTQSKPNVSRSPAFSSSCQPSKAEVEMPQRCACAAHRGRGSRERGTFSPLCLFFTTLDPQIPSVHNLLLFAVASSA